jgi:hypothetical protein
MDELFLFWSIVPVILLLVIFGKVLLDKYLNAYIEKKLINVTERLIELFLSLDTEKESKERTFHIGFDISQELNKTDGYWCCLSCNYKFNIPNFKVTINRQRDVTKVIQICPNPTCRAKLSKESYIKKEKPLKNEGEQKR